MPTPSLDDPYYEAHRRWQNMRDKISSLEYMQAQYTRGTPGQLNAAIADTVATATEGELSSWVPPLPRTEPPFGLWCPSIARHVSDFTTQEQQHHQLKGWCEAARKIRVDVLDLHAKRHRRFATGGYNSSIYYPQRVSGHRVTRFTTPSAPAPQAPTTPAPHAPISPAQAPFFAIPEESPSDDALQPSDLFTRPAAADDAMEEIRDIFRAPSLGR